MKSGHTAFLVTGLIVCGALVAPCAPARGEVVWLEAETPKQPLAGQSGWLAPENPEQAAKLSGGDWLRYGSSPDGAALSYPFAIIAGGDYALFARRFWTHGAFRWRIDGGPWTRSGGEADMLDSVSLKENVALNWTPLGQVALASGDHVLEIRTEKASTPLALDCFCITDGLFIPRGALRPGRRTGLAEDGWWAFEATGDEFGDDCLLDLRYLNEDRAGQAGRVAYRDGRFYGGDGRELRFWGVGVDPAGKSLAQLRYQARRLAKLGVNLVRCHTGFFPRGGHSNLTDVNAKAVDDAQRLVAAMRDEGIYVVISPLFVLNLDIKPSWGVPGFGEGVNGNKPFGLLFWDATLQRGYKAWVGQLLGSENPYTGVPLAEDPALCIFQIQNEDSLLFWTFLNNIPPVQREALGTKFGAWLAGRYGSLDAALKRYGRTLQAGKDGALVGDDPASGVAGLLGAWHMTSKYKGALDPRVADQLRFLSELQFDFNRTMTEFLRDECGYAGLVNAGNWRTCDDAALLDLERWSYTADEVIDVHSYFNGPHVNTSSQPRRASWAVSVGDVYDDASILTSPYGGPTAIRQIAGRPYTVSECTWPQPNRFKAEAPLFVAAYARLVGLDGFIWFHSGSVDYDNAMTKFQVNMPSIMGQFPATALLYRTGLLDEAPAVVNERRAMTDIFARKTAALPEGARFDPNRDASAARRGDGGGELDPLAFLVGRVEVAYADGGASSVKAADLDQYIRRDGGEAVVTSATAQQRLDTAAGVLTVHSDYAACVCGFLAEAAAKAGGRLSVGACRIACGNDYAAISVVSLDGGKLGESSRILIQAMTEDRPYGWRETPRTVKDVNGKGIAIEGRQIDSLGTGPWNVRRIDAEVTLANPRLTRAIVLDEYGYKVREIPVRREGATVTITLPADALYTIVE